MSGNNKKFGLGRGLEALLGDDEINLDDVDNVENFVNNTVSIFRRGIFLLYFHIIFCFAFR